jgi:ABC-2 type transport system permease protein
MNAIAKSPFAWLLKREYWESRKGFLWAPFWTVCVLLVISVLSIATLEIFRSRFSENLNISTNGTNLNEMLNNALSHNTSVLVKGLDASMLSIGVIAGTVLTFVVFFYFLGALYDDRRDRSILFWKSLPVSDTATVASKVVSGVLVAPLITVGIVLAAYVCNQVIYSLWFAAHGLNPFTLIWAHIEPFQIWLHMLAMVPLYVFWALPTVGWLLFWSAAVRSKPFLWAVVIPIAAGALNSWIALLGIPHINVEFFWSQLVARSLLSVVPTGWVTVMNAGNLSDAPEAIRHFGSYAQMAHVFATPELWIGTIVGIALIAAATWFRRWRDEV